MGIEFGDGFPVRGSFRGSGVADYAVVDAHVGFVDDDQVAVLARLVGEEVEGEDDGAVAGVLEGHHAAGGCARGDGGEDVFDARFGAEGESRVGEGVECGLVCV